MAGTGQSQIDARIPPEGARAWTEGYAPLPGAADELIGLDGRLRPAWARFVEALGGLRPEDLARGFGSAERHIRDAGVAYRVHGEARERAWPVSPLPILIEGGEWRAIAAGVAQRARLMEALLAELYSGGPAPEGTVPPAALMGGPNFLRPLVGVAPPGGRHLHLYAADLGRGPDGRWWVLSDRAQAPSGAGYALENRIVLSRAYPQILERLPAKRLAPFFGAFRDGLAAAAERATPRIGLFTPGPYSETYFEQATLARYLGFPLVEGDDLVVRGGETHVRTVSGLKRVDVLWRRVDGDYCDPLALDARSRLGVPGLVEALRRGGVVVANMPGSGAVESRALLAFAAAQARRLLGEDLLLPNVATWWCGEPQARAEALSRLDALAVAEAFSAAPSTLAASLGTEERARLEARLAARGLDYVAQEVVRLSTTPTWREGRLVPRPYTLRVYAAATPQGFVVMPGGFARIAENPDARAISMGEGVLSADVWVLADAPEPSVSLIPPEARRVRRVAGHLPSRAADNLFWLGRYLERAEGTARLVRALLAGRAEERDAEPGERAQARLRHLLLAWGAARPEAGPALAARALADEGAVGSVAAALAAARRAAAALRDRIAPDAWRLIVELVAEASADAQADPLGRAEALLERLAAVSGLVAENMVRGAGWRFLDLGRRVERAINGCRFVRALAGDAATPSELDALLEVVDCQIAYRSRYRLGPMLEPARDLAALDPDNPRSIAFQARAIVEHLEALPVLREDGLPEPARRQALAVAGALAVAEPAELDVEAILALEQDLMALADAIAARYFPHGAAAERPEKLSGLA